LLTDEAVIADTHHQRSDQAAFLQTQFGAFVLKSRIGGVSGMKLEDGLADADVISTFEQTGQGDALAIDIGAIATAEVEDVVLPASNSLDHGMVARGTAISRGMVFSLPLPIAQLSQSTRGKRLLPRGLCILDRLERYWSFAISR
jgi:hypothetical protein